VTNTIYHSLIAARQHRRLDLLEPLQGDFGSKSFHSSQENPKVKGYLYMATEGSLDLDHESRMSGARLVHTK
jgi:hypothetical protein